MGFVLLTATSGLAEESAPTPSQILSESQRAFRAGDHARVVELLSTSVLEEMDPRQARTGWLRLGDAYQQLGDLERAEACYLTSVWLPDLPSTERWLSARHLGRFLAENEELERAHEWYLSLFHDERLAPNERGTALHSLGQLWFRQGEYERAYEVFSLHDSGPFVGWKTDTDLEGRAQEMRARLDNPPGFWIDPYSSHVDQNRALVTWVSKEEAPESTLEPVEVPEGSVLEFDYSREPVRGATEFHIHRVWITGLQPGQRYLFRAVSGDESREVGFRAAPREGEPVHFLVYGDSQDRPRYHTQTANAMATEDADFVLHTGDVVGRGNYWGHWGTQYFWPARNLLRNAIVWPTYGNHDGGPFYSQLFTHDRPVYHNFRYGDVEVFVVASYSSGGVGSRQRDQQLEWLRDALAESTAPWRVAITHYPMISEDSAGWSNWGQVDFWPLFEEGELDFVFVGHHHVYRRIPPISQGGKWAVRHMVSGGAASVGGDYGHGGTGRRIRANPLSEAGAAALHYLSVHVEGDRMKIDAILRDGTILDTIEIIKGDGYQQRLMEESLPWNLAADVIKWLPEFETRNMEVPVYLLEVPEAGQPVPVEIRHHPATDREVSVSIRSVEGNDWMVAEDEVAELHGRNLRFSLTPQQSVTLAPGRISPSPVVEMSWEVDGHKMPYQRFRLTLSEQGYMDLADYLENGTRLPLFWQFRFDPDLVGVDSQWYFAPLGSEGWEEAPVTRPWNDVFDVEYNGNAWYRVDFESPELAEDEELWLEMGTVDESCWVYLNGQLLAAQEYDSLIDDDAWRKPRRFLLNSALQPGTNQLAVRVRANVGEGGIYRGARLYRSPSSLLSEGMFTEGLNTWEVLTGAGQRAVVIPGRYVGEWSIEVDLEDSPDLVIAHPGSVQLQSDRSYRLSTALTQRVPPTHESGVQIVARPLDGGSDEVLLSLAPSVDGRIEEISTEWTPNRTGDFQIVVTLPGDSWVHLDEVQIVPLRLDVQD